MGVLLLLNDRIFSANLGHLRRKRHLSQLSLARRANVSVHYLRGVEKGRLSSQFRLEEYMKLCSVLRVSPTAMGTVLLDAEKANKKEMTLD